ncbi:cellulase CEL7A [Rhodocollybia butyracea]|uniref:Glucanase n=1 Tax=Rhodocollybia butyracea TaxID=206335 RepID=A0A9P5PZ55_9AGAR|nr:cellulase CEL7A [Rhodocollybia butyracea]
MLRSSTLFSFAFFAVAYGQQIGTPEVHPPLTWESCSTSGCVAFSSSVVIDANWRDLHIVNGTTSCFERGAWNFDICTTPEVCAANCALDGADYESTGVTTNGDELTMNFVTNSEQPNVGSRLYVMTPGSETEYQLFHPVNREISFTVDVSNLPGGVNGAVYFTQMDADGGIARFPGNKAGAQYGTGYCDSQCPKDVKFIDGVANTIDWSPSGTGSTGSCCTEMDIWEANSISAAFASHACTVTEQTSCTGTNCSTQGVCDQTGCEFDSFRLGNTSFYGPKKTIDTTQPFTVVTQYISSNNDSNGALSTIRRLYVQNGVIIQNSETKFPGITATNQMDATFCTQEAAALRESDTFDTKGGFDAMTSAMNTGMILAFSIWEESITSGVPAATEAELSLAKVVFSEIRVGTIGATFGNITGNGTQPSAPTTTGTATSTVSAPGATQTIFGQCGGIGYTGPTICPLDSTCLESNPDLSQCVPS